MRYVYVVQVILRLIKNKFYLHWETTFEKEVVVTPIGSNAQTPSIYVSKDKYEIFEFHFQSIAETIN